MNNPYLLYVEDDEIEVMKFIHTAQEYFDTHCIKIAKDGQSGLDWLEKNRLHLPKIIVLDINMPRMNGLQFLEIIKNDLDFRNIPVVMLTTSDNHKDILTSYKNQVAGYFVKPFDPNQYKAIIQTINQYWQQSHTIY